MHEKTLVRSLGVLTALGVAAFLGAAASGGQVATPASPAATPGPPATSTATVDEKVDRDCGEEPFEKKLKGRLAHARLDARAVAATTRCYDLRAKGSARAELKLLRGFDAAAEATLRRCLEDSDVHDPSVIAALTDYVRAALTPDAADRRLQQAYAACYADVLNCGKHPCPRAAQLRRPGLTGEPLTLSVQLLAASPGSGTFGPVAAGVPLRTGQTVRFHVTTSKRAFVYILQRSSTGALSVLFPDSAIRATNPLPAGSLQLPPGDSFTLQDPPGREALIVVASEHEPVGLVTTLAGRSGGPSASGRAPSASAAVDEALHGLEAARPVEAPSLASPPTGDDRATRGLVLSSRAARPSDDTSEPAFTARAAQGDDTVIAQIGFTHVAGVRP